ncbi:TrbI/VirB10 family protein [Sphingomonas sp. ASV193]|uniref:TrbI/VirB10 family protein n=1 Tax=Sphingomonas sp. ASV193 TaxID=3144405 RepID=UPI0032E9378C
MTIVSRIPTEPEHASRPLVARTPRRTPLYVFIAVLGLFAIYLFASLNAARVKRAEAEAGGPIAVPDSGSAPALVLPPIEASPSALPSLLPIASPTIRNTVPTALAPVPSGRVATAPRTVVVQTPAPFVPPAYPPAAMPPFVAPSPPTTSGLSTSGPTRGDPFGRTGSMPMANPSFTIAQGTMIPAVLESALNSTHPGPARALVTRDVSGFDGSRVLVPRGSRLFGDYSGSVRQGQKRALIKWTRLLRPDGVSIALDSPSADSLGRAGVEAHVNFHVMSRVGNALIGGASTIGTALLGARPATTVILNSTTSTAAPVQIGGRDVAPTLTVNPGARIAVFVAHDLDFSPTDAK